MEPKKYRTRLPRIALAEVPLGVVTGAAVGAFAGPVGLVAGALIGSAVGAGLAIAQNRAEHWDHEIVDRYDDELGIMGGDLGAPGLSHPPPVIGAYSTGSAGASTGRGGPISSGPFEEID
jgi:hypothetical protein